MNFRTDGSKWVEPDKRKGLIQLKQSTENNQLVHFTWKDRTTGTEDLNLMLFANDASFRKVNEANSRVYVLEWASNDQKFFFWMQEAKDDKDKENCDNINKFISNPPQAAADAPLGDLGGIGRQQLLQLLGGNAGSLGGLSGILGNMPTGAGRGRSTPSTTASQPRSISTQSSNAKPPSSTTSLPPQQSTDTSTRPTRPPPSSAPQPKPLQVETLQQLLSQLTQTTKEPSLKEIINADEILASGLFDQPEVVAKLAEYLPQGQVTAQNLKENIRSPQFQQAVAMFNQALRTGQLAGIMSSFGLDPSSIGPNSSIEDFLRAIQKKAKEEQAKDSKMDSD